MQYVEVQEVTITGPVKNKGSNRVQYNYDLNGVPFGCVYTYKAKGEVHPFTAVTAKGDMVGQFKTRDEADKAIRAAM